MIEMFDDDNSGNTSVAEFNGMWPYWMSSSESVENTFELNGMFLLTAPNMSGKSTLMRSAAAVCLLGSIGACGPTNIGTRVRSFNDIFVRGASADVPSEGKSAFGAEMLDVSALMRVCGENSLVFVDELARGTSPKDGTSLAAAILEKMAERGMNGFFATHLHDILNLELSEKSKRRIKKKKMGDGEVGGEGGGDKKDDMWSYKLEDGTCENSRALVTAKRFGLDDEIIDRARELAEEFENLADDGKLRRGEIEKGKGKPTSTSTSTSTSTPKEFTLKKALKLASWVVYGNDNSDNNTGFVVVKPKYIPPPSLEGKCCVYLLSIKKNDAAPTRFYVGESESFASRLGQHRATYGIDRVEAAAISVRGGKSEARKVETLIIRKLVEEGFPMEAIGDIDNRLDVQYNR